MPETVAVLFASLSFSVLVLPNVVDCELLPLVPKQPGCLVPKPVRDSAASGTASERKLLLCGEGRGTPAGLWQGRFLAVS